MESNLAFFNNLPEGFSKRTILEMVIAQIDKDTSLFGFEYKSVGNPEEDLGLLKINLASLLKKMDQLTGNQLMSLFYQVDVSQAVLQKSYDLASSERYLFLAEAILNRELKKVLTKIYYKTKG